MLIFNTTYHVEDDVRDSYLEYIIQTYIPKATSSGFLHLLCFARIHPQHEEQGSSYSLQFKVKNVDTFNYWFENGGQVLNSGITEKFANKVLGFVTFLEEID